MDIIVTHIDTACCHIQFGDYKILTDPVLDKASGFYHHGYGAISKKRESPILKNIELTEIDLVLLSHPQHKDNFDKEGRKFSKTVPQILSTKKIEKEFKNGKGLIPWQTFTVKAKDKTHELKITATPAQHHPNWMPEFISGKVIGFYLESNTSEKSLYISGDTIYYKGIQEIAQKLNPTFSLIHVGSAELRYLAGLGKFTMDPKGFIETVKTLNSKITIPIHNSGWTHFKENDKGIKRELANEKELLKKKIFFIERGINTDLNDFKG